MKNQLINLRRGAIGLVSGVGTFLAGATTFAATNIKQNLTTNASAVGQGAGFSEQPLQTTIGTLISSAMGVLGIVIVCFFIYAGFLWMTAQGDAKQIDKAKGIMMSTVIGLVILLSAYAITNFVLNAVLSGTATQ